MQDPAQTNTNYNHHNVCNNIQLPVQMNTEVCNPTIQQQMMSRLELSQTFLQSMNPTTHITPTSLNNNDISIRQQKYDQSFHYVTNHNVPLISPATPTNSRFNLPPTPPDLESATLPQNCNNGDMQKTKQDHCSKKSTSRSSIPLTNTPPIATQNFQSQQLSNDNLKEKEPTFTIDGVVYDLDTLKRKDKETKFLESMIKKKISSRKQKNMSTCKTCKKKFETKDELYKCLEKHIEPSKLFRCPLSPNCPFVSELKHFWEFHVRKHLGLKDLKCMEPGCSYTCEVKSSLTSHMKSHSENKPYKCGECEFTSKHLHTFKKHLKNRQHSKYYVLDDQGNSTDKQIDIYGRKRGPKSNLTGGSIKRKCISTPNSQQSPPVEAPQLMAALQGNKMVQQYKQEQPMDISPASSTNSTTDQILTSVDPQTNTIPNFVYNAASALIFNHWIQLQQNKLIKPELDDETRDEGECKSSDFPLDLSVPAVQGRHTPENDAAVNLNALTDNHFVETPLAGSVITPARRKGRVLQLDNSLHMNITAQSMDDEESNTLSSCSISTPEESPEIFSRNCYNTTPSLNSNDSGTRTSNELEDKSSTSSTNNKQSDAMHECKHCGLLFRDPVLCTLHKGYHSHDDPFKCNLCGTKCHNHVDFHVHLARAVHA